MKAIALTNKGIEDISALEITELIGSKPEMKDEHIIFEFEKFEDLFKLCYRAQAITRILYMLDDFSWLEGKTYSLNPKDADVKLPGKVNLSNPDFMIYVIDGSVCIDFSEDISKRHYRIFMGSETLKSTSSYALLRTAGYEAKKVLVDPFCRAGTIPIEAALYACRFSQHFFNKDFPFIHFEKFKDFDFEKLFDKLDKQANLGADIKINALDRDFRSIQAAKKNAKIAGIIKKINFSKKEIELADIKFDEKSVDIIATRPLQPSSAIPEALTDKIYKELFYQAEYILKDKGIIAVIVRTGIEQLKKWSAEYKFKLLEERKIMQGKETWTILKFQK